VAMMGSMTENHYEALCWGGPLDGQWVASPEPEMRAARTLPLRRLLEGAPSDAVPYFVDQYRYERYAFGPLTFGAWVIAAPAERREAVMRTITDGMNAIYGMSLLLGDWRS
jgi:hypothetical protein